LDSLRESIETFGQNHPPLRVINGYSILDLLGTGAFSSVFKVEPPAEPFISANHNVPVRVDT
jgi:hypothetical protein